MREVNKRATLSSVNIKVTIGKVTRGNKLKINILSSLKKFVYKIFSIPKETTKINEKITNFFIEESDFGFIK